MSTDDKDAVRRVLGKHWKPSRNDGGPSWLTVLGRQRQSVERRSVSMRVHPTADPLGEGRVESKGELARRLEVSQPRITQPLNLTYLAPAIQAEVAGVEWAPG